MDEKTTYWASILLGAGALLLLVVNMSVANGNRLLQDEITQRAQTINSGATLDQINKGLVQALADISIKDSDADARGLLGAQGITIAPAPKADKIDKVEKPEKTEKEEPKAAKKKPELTTD